MRFFITESQRKQKGGTCYFEFQRGQKDPDYRFVCWREDSLLLHMELADGIALYRIVPDFQYYGVTVIDREKWSMIRTNVNEHGAKAIAVIDELCSWAEENFKEYDYFVIVGL